MALLDDGYRGGLSTLDACNLGTHCYPDYTKYSTTYLVGTSTYFASGGHKSRE